MCKSGTFFSPKKYTDEEIVAHVMRLVVAVETHSKPLKMMSAGDINYLKKEMDKIEPSRRYALVAKWKEKHGIELKINDDQVKVFKR